MMIEYFIAAAVVAFLLGWILGNTAGKSTGYALATQEVQRQMAQAAMAAQFNSMFKEDKNGNAEA